MTSESAAQMTGGFGAASKTPHLFSLVAAFFRKDLKIFLSYKMALIMNLSSVIFIVPMFYFMGKLIGEAQPEALARFNYDYFGFLILGSGLLEIFTVTSFTQSSKLREAQMMGTLEAMLTTKLSLTKVVVFSSTFPVTNSLVRFLLKMAVAIFLFGMGVSRADWLAAALVLLACLVTYIGIGMFLSAFVLVFKKGEPLSAILNYATLLFGGVYFPVEYLPGWLQPLGWAIPATHAIEGARAAILTGAPLSELGGAFAGMGLVSLAMFPLGYLTLKWAYKYARERGTLSDY